MVFVGTRFARLSWPLAELAHHQQFYVISKKPFKQATASLSPTSLRKAKNVDQAS